MFKNRWLAFGVSFLLVIVIISGCSSSQVTEEKNGKVKVTTTIGPISDIVKNVGGEHVEVTGLMGPGVDPHLYKASQGDIAKLEEADIIFYNGLNLEGKMADIFVKMARQKPAIFVTEYVPDEGRGTCS
jgi:manganese/zinc/iron transport system substrate-binding protein